MKLFGREPSVIIGLIGALVTALVSMNVGVPAGVGAAITSFITAVIIAATTRPVAPALITGCITALFALLAEFQFHASDAMVSGFTGLALAVLAVIGIRPQVVPAAETARAAR